MRKTKFDKAVEAYTSAIKGIEDIELKGKALLYTSSNGHMFSQMNKKGEIGIRLSKADVEKFQREFGSAPFLSYGTVMKEYVKIPDLMLSRPEQIKKYLKKGLSYVKTLKPK